MNLCYDSQKWTMITLASVATSLTVGLISLAYGQTSTEEQLETLINYCYQHADRPNPIQDLIDKGFLPPNLTETCKSIKQLYDKIQADKKTTQKLMSGKDCPATQHLFNGICEDNADGKAHPSADNPNRSSRLDCASNEFFCRSTGEIK